MLTLAWPWIWLLLPLPWLVHRFTPPARREEAALKVPFFDQLAEPAARPAWRMAPARLRSWLLWMIWLLLLAAASRPLWVGEPAPLESSGRDLLLAVDISGSMEVEDMLLDDERVNRLEAVKAVLGEFVTRRAGDRLGLILFGSEAYIQAPLTFDHRTLNRFLQEAQIGFAGKNTAIGDAIGLGVKRLLERPAESRVLILLTDGANTAGQVEPLNAARVAAGEGVRVYTLGFGADEMLVRSLFGMQRVNPAAELDERTLTGIAEQTGGRYFRARNTEELEGIYRELDRLEPVAQASRLIRPQRALFYWPLAAALLLSLGWALRHSGIKARGRD